MIQTLLVIPIFCALTTSDIQNPPLSVGDKNTPDISPKRTTISLQTILDKLNGSYQIRAHNVTMFIPELVISRSGVEISDAKVKADVLEVLKDSNYSTNFIPSYSIATHDNTTKIDIEPFILHDYPELKSSVNPKLDPCDNFYNFVCTGWEEHHEIEEDETSVNQFTVINDKIEKQIGRILENRTKYDTNRLTGLLFDMYEACMDNTTRDQTGSGIVLDILRKVKSNKGLHTLTDWLIEVYPVSLFYAVSVVPDIREPKRNMISVQPVSLLLGSEKYYIEQRFAPSMEALKNYLRKVLKFLMDDDDQKNVFKSKNVTEEIERMVESFMKVEMAVAEIQNNTDKHYDNVYAGDKIVTLQELREKYAKTINWARYFTQIFPEEILASIPDLAKLEVHVSLVEAIEKLENLSRSLPGQVFADFLEWRIILSYVGFLDDRFIDARFELDQFLQGAQKRSPSWYECKSAVENVLSPIIDMIYVREFFDNDSIPLVLEIFKNVHSSFEGMLTENDWMDDQTKEEALKKLKTLDVHVGYMENLFNMTKWEKYYEGLSLNGSMSFPEMAMLSNAWSFKKNILQLLEPIEIEFSGFIVNGFYYALRNSIVITAGMLQGAFFNTSYPRALNYGSLGNVIGHEITHGFDNNGRLHDGDGRVRDWWNNETEANFKAKKQCLIDQYNAIEIPNSDGIHINGEITQGENIADNGGIRASYKALLKAIESGKEERIRGLEQYSERQLFFFNYAFSWCSKQRLEASIFQILNDNHSPPEARVNVVLGNLPEFSDAFNCPLGSHMNPMKKCRVW